MPWYNDLRPVTDPNKEKYALIFPDFTNEEKMRTIEKLLDLRKSLEPIRLRKLNDKNLLLASWNIKEFGHLKARQPEAYFYIAEVVSSFDLIAIQELKTGLSDLKILMRILGKHWKFIINDITEGKDGNSERSAYIYDTRRVEFSGLAGEIVIWKDLLEQDEEVQQLKRTPYITGFKTAWKKFALINLHLQPGDSPEEKARRKEEVDLLMKVIDTKVRTKRLWSNNLVLMGDFNLYHEDTDIELLMNEYGFYESDLLEGENTNTAMNSAEPFDRIFIRHGNYFPLPSSITGQQGGAIDLFETIYKVDDYVHYKDAMLATKGDPSTLTSEIKFRNYFRDHWRKGQLSDHRPIWLEIDTDGSDQFLRNKLAAFKRVEVSSQ